MNDDELLAAAHHALKEKDALADPRWDVMARGELSARELEALPPDPRAREAFAPMDMAAMERMVLEKMPQKAQVLPFRRFRTITTTVSVLAVAALALFMIRPKNGAMLPTYELTVQGEKLERGEAPISDKSVRIGPGSRVEILLRPATPVHSTVTARVFFARNGHAKPIDVPLQVSEEGVVRIVGSFESVFHDVTPGAGELVCVIGPEAELPNAETVLQFRSDKQDVQLLRSSIWIMDR